MHPLDEQHSPWLGWQWGNGWFPWDLVVVRISLPVQSEEPPMTRSAFQYAEWRHHLQPSISSTMSSCRWRVSMAEGVGTFKVDIAYVRNANLEFLDKLSCIRTLLPYLRLMIPVMNPDTLFDRVREIGFYCIGPDIPHDLKPRHKRCPNNEKLPPIHRSFPWSTAWLGSTKDAVVIDNNSRGYGAAVFSNLLGKSIVWNRLACGKSGTAPNIALHIGGAYHNVMAPLA